MTPNTTSAPASSAILHASAQVLATSSAWLKNTTDENSPNDCEPTPESNGGWNMLLLLANRDVTFPDTDERPSKFNPKRRTHSLDGRRIPIGSKCCTRCEKIKVEGEFYSHLTAAGTRTYHAICRVCSLEKGNDQRRARNAARRK